MSRETDGADAATLRGKVALITGAARGVGRATAVRLARQGCDLALLDIGERICELPYRTGSRRQLLETVDRCRSTGAAVIPIFADLRRQEDVAAGVRSVVDRFTSIDILVNAAGVSAPSGRRAHEIPETEWSLVMDINLTGQWRMVAEVLPVMLAQRRGAVINIASTAGQVGYKRCAAYVASKHGLVGLTRALALECADDGVRINAVCPGSIEDEEIYEGAMLTGIGSTLELSGTEMEKFFRESQPTGRLVGAESVASAVQWLASDDAVDVTGSVIAVDGGYSAK